MVEANLCKHVEKNILEPSNPTQLATHQKKEAKVKIINLDFLKDHFISHIVDNMSGESMFDALVSLYLKILVPLDRCSCKTCF